MPDSEQMNIINRLIKIKQKSSVGFSLITNKTHSYKGILSGFRICEIRPIVTMRHVGDIPYTWL